MCSIEDIEMLCVRERGGGGCENNSDMLCHAKAIKRDAGFFLDQSREDSTIFSDYVRQGECKQWPDLWMTNSRRVC